jgi:hypothetical protein
MPKNKPRGNKQPWKGREGRRSKASEPVPDKLLPLMALADLRREQVSRMILTGATVREIIEGLHSLDSPILSPDSADGRWTPITIRHDLQVLRAEWRKNALEDVVEHKARQLAEIAHAKRWAWAREDLPSIIRLIRLDAEITGTLLIAGEQAPEWRDIARRMGLDPEALLRFVQEQMRSNLEQGRSLPAAQQIVDDPGSNGHEHAG